MTIKPTAADMEAAQEVSLWCYICTVDRPAMGQGPTAELNIAKAATIIAQARAEGWQAAIQAAASADIVAAMEEVLRLARLIAIPESHGTIWPDKAKKAIDCVDAYLAAHRAKAKDGA